MNPPTIIAEQLHDHWTACLENHPESGYGGDTLCTAI